MAAVVGALAALYTIVKTRRRLKRKVSVKMSWGVLTYPNGTLSDWMIFVKVSNPGERAVIVNVPYLQLRGKDKMFFPAYKSDVNFPYKLEEGGCCSIWNKESEIQNTLRDHKYKGKVRVRAVVEDQTDKPYRSRKTYKIDLDVPSTREEPKV